MTIQDLGPHGYQRFGVWVSGEMDRWALVVENGLLSTLTIRWIGPYDPSTATVFRTGGVVAMTGADLSSTSNGSALPLWTGVAIPAGSRLQFDLRR